MIVVDESIHDQILLDAIAKWYPGRVISVQLLRLDTIIKDEAIPNLLLKAKQPTFVTINVIDFWRKVLPHHAYGIVAVSIPQSQMYEVSEYLRRLLRIPNFRTKAKRMGKVIRARASGIEYYETNRRVQSLTWPN